MSASMFILKRYLNNGLIRRLTLTNLSGKTSAKIARSEIAYRFGLCLRFFNHNEQSTHN